MTPLGVQALAPCVLALSVAAILYGGFTALAQSDMKKLVAYSSVAHMGFVTLGIFLLNSEGARRRDPADGQPWHHHRRIVPLCRDYL